MHRLLERFELEGGPQAVYTDAGLDRSLRIEDTAVCPEVPDVWQMV